MTRQRLQNIQRRQQILSEQLHELSLLRQGVTPIIVPAERIAEKIVEKEIGVQNLRVKIRNSSLSLLFDVKSLSQRVSAQVSAQVSASASSPVAALATLNRAHQNRGPGKSKPSRGSQRGVQEKKIRKTGSGIPCACGKQGFPDIFSANCVLTNLKSARWTGNSRRNECRVYLCPIGGLYHTTSQEKNR